MNKTPTKKITYFEKYDLYSDANPKDTVRVKYKTLQDVKETIKKLEKLYKSGKIKHNRNSQIVNVMVQRLRVINDRFNKGKDRLNLIRSYFDFLKKRTKNKNDNERKKLIFKI